MESLTVSSSHGHLFLNNPLIFENASSTGWNMGELGPSVAQVLEGMNIQQILQHGNAKHHGPTLIMTLPLALPHSISHKLVHHMCWRPRVWPHCHQGGPAHCTESTGS